MCNDILYKIHIQVSCCYYTGNLFLILTTNVNILHFYYWKDHKFFFHLQYFDHIHISQHTSCIKKIKKNFLMIFLLSLTFFW